MAQPCPAARFDATVLQILRRDAIKPQPWPAIMRRLAQFRLREVIVQWSSADATAFYAGRAGATDVVPVLADIVRSAHDAGLRSWIGLHQDSGWWSAASRPDADLEAFLAARLSDLQSRLPALVAALASVPKRGIAGWYLTEELDNDTWRSAAREAALTDYLQKVTRLLRRAAPGRPIAVSAFANGSADAPAYGAQLRRIADAAGVQRLLLQDGIGAGKCSPAQARAVATAIARAMRGSTARFGVIVEFFDFADPERAPGATQPAPIDVILDRTAATAGLTDLPATSFSHAHHLTALGGPVADARGAQWLAMLQRCAPVRR